MSVYRDRLPVGQLAAFDEAIAAGGQLLADASRERDELAAAGGPRAVALAAHYPGHAMTVDEIEAYYQRLQDEARRRQE